MEPAEISALNVTVSQNQAHGPFTGLFGFWTTERVQLFKDGSWIAGGHALAAIAALVGIRFITEIAEPSVFGAFALVNGILALLQGVLLQPMAQAAFRYYPDFAMLNGASELRRHLSLYSLVVGFGARLYLERLP